MLCLSTSPKSSGSSSDSSSSWTMVVSIPIRGSYSFYFTMSLGSMGYLSLGFLFYCTYWGCSMCWIIIFQLEGVNFRAKHSFILLKMTFSVAVILSYLMFFIIHIRLSKLKYSKYREIISTCSLLSNILVV